MRLVGAWARGGCAQLTRRSCAAVVSASLALLAAGCHVAGGPPGQAAGGQQIAVAVVPGFATAPLQVAVEDRAVRPAPPRRDGADLPDAGAGLCGADQRAGRRHQRGLRRAALRAGS